MQYYLIVPTKMWADNNAVQGLDRSILFWICTYNLPGNIYDHLSNFANSSFHLYLVFFCSDLFSFTSSMVINTYIYINYMVPLLFLWFFSICGPKTTLILKSKLASLQEKWFEAKDEMSKGPSITIASDSFDWSLLEPTIYESWRIYMNKSMSLISLHRYCSGFLFWPSINGPGHLF